MNAGDAWQCNGHPRVSFMRHLALWSFCAEHSANCYDVAMERWMLTCANTICSQRLQAQIMPRLKFPVNSHYMALRWCSCSPAASETNENPGRADMELPFSVFFFLLLIQILIHLHYTHQSCRGNQDSKMDLTAMRPAVSCNHMALFSQN